MWRVLHRDWRAGELTVLGAALLVAIASLTSVGFLTDRVAQGMALEARQLLGGDLLLSADHPIADDIRQEAAQRGLQQADLLIFPSMARTTETAQLADIKAVSAGYPLRGELRIADSQDAAAADNSRPTRQTPAPGTVWLDERLSTALAVQPNDSIRLGASQLTVSAILTQEPDRGMGMFGFAPRLLMNLDDLAATGLVRPASRISYRLQFSGEAAAVAAFSNWLQPRLERGERLEDMTNARPEMRTVLDRAERFLRLAALLAVVLAAIAVGFATDRYIRRHLDGCAVMRCLGASQSQLLLIHVGEFVLFGLFATLAGCLLGYAMQLGLQSLLAGLFSAYLPPPSARPWLHGLLVGLVLVGGFAVPPLLRLSNVATLRVLRREWDDAARRLPRWLNYVPGLLALMGLMLWIAGELQLGTIVIAGFALAFGLYALLARLLLAGLTRNHNVLGRYPSLRLGLASLRRHTLASVLQAASLALGLTTLLLLGVARDDLLASWQNRMPPDAPNRFVINIQPEQRQELRDFFTAAGLPAPHLEPMIRGRLTAINDTPVMADRYADERAQHLANREFNLSWTSELPTGNRIKAGRWHGEGQPRSNKNTDNEETEFSVEQGLARTLELKLGDRLSYDIAGQQLTGRITSLRQLNWDSMRVNFFIIAPPGILENYPASDITSFHLPSEQRGFINQLVHAFPNLTVIDVSTLARQLQNTVDQLARAIELVFSFALLAGLVVLYAALQASQDQRRYELALLRALGARHRQLRSALLVEFALLGGVAGLLAGLGASAISWSVAHFALQLDYLPTLNMPLLGLLIGSLGIAAAGWSGTVSKLRSPAMVALRETA
ncbi:MAG: FtsX-like permease family protein [Sterolibacterium sp.]|nr:FtsX-like permease family protein [Sterolibacterium sp.]